MRLSKILFILSLSVSCIQGCYYGKETLKVVHPETIFLIEHPGGDESKKILKANEKAGWFFIPQVIFRPHEDKAWLALRVYSRSRDLSYEVVSSEASLPHGDTIEANRLTFEGLDWYPAEGGWFYQVIKVKNYNYSSLISSNIRTASVTFELIANNELQSKTFDLEVKRVRRSGW